MATSLSLGLAACESKGKKSNQAAPAAGGGGAPAQPPGDLATVLATVDGTTITVGEFQDRLNRQSPYIRARYTSIEQKKEFLDSLVRFEVLAAEAAKRGFDKDPEVVRTMKQVMIQKLLRDEFETKVTPESITEAEIKAYYDAHADEFLKPEEVRASAVVVKTQAQAERVAKEAAGDAGKTNKGFRDLVSTYTTNDEQKLRGGDLRYLSTTTKDVPKPVIAAAFALANTGDVSGVVDAGDGTYWVLKQTGRRKALTRTLEDATQTIRNKLYRDKRLETQKAFVEGLRNAAKVEILEDNLAKVRVDTSLEGGDPHGDAAPLPDFSQPLPPPTTPMPMPEPPPVAPAGK
ncbi:MAG: peptidyl-prolyl cis-trans isomerase [Myxococcales bacterium]|nr:peptidyl-prolyl cis-trans isomerase [Myxococcales bacterium]